MHNAIHDITEKDLVALRWHRLKREASILRPEKKENWITKILKRNDRRN